MELGVGAFAWASSLSRSAIDLLKRGTFAEEYG